jgi:hypothetical protein
MFRKIAFSPSTSCITVGMLIDECRPGIDATFQEIIKKRIKCKVNVCIQILFYKINISDGTVDEENRGYMSVNAITFYPATDDVGNLLEEARIDLDEKIDNYTNRGSNWVVGAIEQLILSLVAFK